MTAQPVLAPTRGELQALLRPHRGVAAVALVPTMGALHDGHAALIREARREVEGPVVVSIFVNPLQFAPGEDLDRYPRTLDDDLEVCAAAGADIVFAPPVEEVYPAGVPSGPDTAAVTVDPGRLGEVLEGASRPTHFRGVLTVVAKLFGLVRPDVAVFGQKDYQQLVLIRRMAADLCQGVRVVGCATVREADGLALSSRNRYLDAGQRDAARALSCALDAGRGASEEGAAGVLAAARAALELAGDVDLDYLELTDPNLGPAPSSGEARLLIAARVGSTRLIDNAPVHLSTTLQPTSTSRRGDH